MITVITIITVATVILTSYGLGYVAGRFYNNGVTKDYLTELSAQVSNKIIHDIRGGLNGVRNAVDDTTVKVVGFREHFEEICLAIASEFKRIELDRVFNNDCVTVEDELLDPKPEVYHNQEVKLSNQNENALRISIDSLWQKAYVNCTENEIEEAYKELGRVHRQLTAIILKLKKGGRI